MIPKPFDQIAKDDLDSLVTNQVKERRTIEYQQQLPRGSDSDKKEFLADVSSFANAAWGDLIFGIVDKRDAVGKPTGIPESVPGLTGINADAEIRRLEAIIRDGIKPRIAGIHLRSVDGFASGPVLLIRIQKSYAAPHMVTFQEHSRFYSRTSSGKYALDVGEIRSAFALSVGLPKGSVSAADGHLYVRGEKSGDVALVEATPEGYQEKGRLKQAERSARMAWPHPVIAGGRLYLRDADVLLCYEIKVN